MAAPVPSFEFPPGTPWWIAVVEKFGFPALVAAALGWVLYGDLKDHLAEQTVTNTRLTQIEKTLEDRTVIFDTIIANQAKITQQNDNQTQQIQDEQAKVQAGHDDIKAQLTAVEKRLDDVFASQRRPAGYHLDYKVEEAQKPPRG